MRKRLICVSLLFFLLIGCTERVRTPRVLPEWGRANLIGAASRSTPVSLVVSTDGTRVMAAWPARPESVSPDYLHLFVLDENGEITIDQNLEPPIPDLDNVQVLPGTDNIVHLLWTAGQQNARVLWYASLNEIDLSNSASLSAKPVSPADRAVTWYKAALLPNGDILILWLETRGELNGQIVGHGKPQRLLPDVIGVDFQLDVMGNIYLVWSEQQVATQLALYRAQLTSSPFQLTPPILVTTVLLPFRASVNSVEGPVLALDHRYAYLSWIQREDDSSQVVKRLNIITWALDGTAESSLMEPLTHALDFPPSSTPASGYFAYQNLAVPFRSQGSPMNVYQTPTTLNVQEEETVLAVAVQYATRTRLEYQPTLVYVRDGKPLGYQALTWTDHTSNSPVVATDAQHNLYVAWNDKTGAAFDYPVYLASTAPVFRTSRQWITIADYVTIAWDYINRIASGVVLFPFVVVWFFFPLAWLFFRLSRGSDVFGPAGQRLLLSALWIYWAGKYILTFQILTYVPGLRYMTSNVGDVLIYCAPLLLLALSVTVGGWLTIYRTDKAFSVMRTFLTTVAVDAILSLSLYAVGYFE